MAPSLLGNMGNSEEKGAKLMSFLMGRGEEGAKEEARAGSKLSPSRQGQKIKEKERFRKHASLLEVGLGEMGSC